MSDQPALLARLDRSGAPLLLARLALGGLFIYMGWVKAADPAAFMKLIHEYEIAPPGLPRFLNWVAAILPWWEILLGILLVLGIAIRGSALTLLIMLTGFTIIVTLRAIGIHDAKGTPFCDIKFDCGCGGGEVYICRKILENAGLWLLSLLVLLSKSRRWCARGDLVRKTVIPQPTG